MCFKRANAGPGSVAIRGFRLLKSAGADVEEIREVCRLLRQTLSGRPDSVRDVPKVPSEQAAMEADRTSSDADHASATADAVAAGRDVAAADRQIVSEARDRAATARDRAAEEREFAEGPGGPEYVAAIIHAAGVRAHAAADRELAAADRGRATLDRQEAEADRERAASDRQHAAMDREHAAMDRRDARAELQHAHTDDLTGAYRRGAGEVALQHEFNRARRSGEGLVMAFVDVDGLKKTNDRHGHAAGDARLRDVVDAMRSKLRSYEPIVRYGGDEFLCMIAGVALTTVRLRFDEIGAVLRDRDHPGSMSVGLAEMHPGDTLDEFINRADGALVKARGNTGRS
jgi:diguanylate cyclase (GGDEF)-like protein